jgi:hypothetical protein
VSSTGQRASDAAEQVSDRRPTIEGVTLCEQQRNVRTVAVAETLNFPASCQLLPSPIVDQTDAHSRRMVLESHPPRFSGSRTLPMFWTSRSQVICAASAACSGSKMSAIAATDHRVGGAATIRVEKPANERLQGAGRRLCAARARARSCGGAFDPARAAGTDTARASNSS